MTALGRDMKAIAAFLSRDSASVSADVVDAARQLADANARLPALFPPGSGGPHSRAKPEIWDTWEDFTKHAGAFRMAAEALERAVGDDNRAAMNSHLAATGKICHQAYRKPESD